MQDFRGSMTNIKAEKNEGEGVNLRIVDSPQIDKAFDRWLKGGR